MSTAAGERIMNYLEAVRLALETCGLFLDVRLHLDPYDLSDVMKESFRPPAARVFILKMEPQTQADSGVHVDVTLGIVAIAGRSGRPDDKVASADLAAMSLILNAAAVIRQDPYFGQTRLTAARLEGFRVATSEKSNDKGLAITLLQVSSTLLHLIPEWAPVAAMVDGTRPPGAGLTVNGEIVEPQP